MAGMSHADTMSIDDSAPGQVPEGVGTDAQPDEGDSQEIGALLGVAMGGKVSPGGLAAEGRYLYRLSELDWLETSVHFSLGAGGKECFRDRESSFVCEHGLLDGFAAEGSVGLRRYFVGQQQFRPYVRAGVGLQLVSFADDSVLGAGVPLYLGAGVRVAVANRVLVVADATARAGVSLLNQDLGIEPNLSLSIAAGVEFTLE
jgi:hypothetical protein